MSTLNRTKANIYKNQTISIQKYYNELININTTTRFDLPYQITPSFSLFYLLEQVTNILSSTTNSVKIKYDKIFTTNVNPFIFSRESFLKVIDLLLRLSIHIESLVVTDYRTTPDELNDLFNSLAIDCKTTDNRLIPKLYTDASSVDIDLSNVLIYDSTDNPLAYFDISSSFSNSYDTYITNITRLRNVIETHMNDGSNIAFLVILLTLCYRKIISSDIFNVNSEFKIYKSKIIKSIRRVKTMVAEYFISDVLTNEDHIFVTDCLLPESIVNVVDGYILLNDRTLYNDKIQYGVYDGIYFLKDIQKTEPITIIGGGSDISFSAPKELTTIDVSGGSTTYPYFTFTPDITDPSFLFLPGYSYRFQCDNLSSSTPFFVSDVSYNMDSTELDISGSVDVSYNIGISGNDYIDVDIPFRYSKSEFYYYNPQNSDAVHALSVPSTLVDGLYRKFYYGDIELIIYSGGFGRMSYYGLYGGYMGGENNIVYTPDCLVEN